MAKIISISTAVPQYKHDQKAITNFMELAYDIDDAQKRVLRYIYKQGGIDTRYSVVPDYTVAVEDREFFPKSANLEPFPSLELRMEWYDKFALPLSLQAATKCIDGMAQKESITHLITVSCTGMSAPGLELQIAEAMELSTAIDRTSVNFMGCYAAIHGLKQAKNIVEANPGSKVLMICTELCTLHFQKVFAEEYIAAPLLFADGCAAVLITGDEDPRPGVRLDSFYSEVLPTGKKSMTWDLSSTGFVMSLGGDVPDLFHKHIAPFKEKALQKAGGKQEIDYWCIHPGGRRILEVISQGLALSPDDLASSYETLREYGNMSSATVMFVLKHMWDKVITKKGSRIFGAAFGPGLTMESMILSVV